MRTFLLFVAVLVVGSKALPVEKYTTRYDNIDIDAILKSDRLLNSYINCIMDRGVCTKEGKILRDVIPDALLSECSKCSEVQKVQAGKVLGFLLQEKRSFWNELVAKYDPEGTFRKKYDFHEEDEDYDYEEEEEETPKAAR